MNRGNVIRVVFVIAVVVAVVAVYRSSPGALLEAAVTWSREHPTVGALAYVAFVCVATVAFLPGSVSMMLAGFLFGTLFGSVYALIGMVTGAQLAFFAGRLLARSSIEQRMHASERLQAIDAAIHISRHDSCERSVFELSS